MSKELIRLSCGGISVVVSAQLLRRAPPRLQQLLQQTPDMDGFIQIDRDHLYFAPLVHYLRTGHLTIDPGISTHGVVAEAACVGTHSWLLLLILDQVLGPETSHRLDDWRGRFEAAEAWRDLRELAGGASQSSGGTNRPDAAHVRRFARLYRKNVTLFACMEWMWWEQLGWLIVPQ